MPSRVGLLRCPEYDAEKLHGILESALQANPRWLAGIQQGSKVFLKLNLLMKKKPEEAVTTHPTVVEAVTRLLQERGAIVIIGDSPGGPYLPVRLKSIYRVCGIEGVAKRTGAILNYDVSEVVVPFPEGRVTRSFHVIKPVTEADYVISLSKLKTHMMTKFTGAVKNLFGTIPGLRKADYHLKMPKTKDFCDMLIDLALCVKPVLHIMDGIIGMEGKGPSGGKPRQVGALLMSDDPFALDVVALNLVGIVPETVPTVASAKARGLVYHLSQVEIYGDLAQWHIKHFVAPKISGNVKFPIPDLITNALRPKPVFLQDTCIGCGDCVTNCPPQALEIKNGYPVVDLEKCIRCFCCQELCPRKAIDIKRNPLGRLLER